MYQLDLPASYTLYYLHLMNNEDLWDGEDSFVNYCFLGRSSFRNTWFDVYILTLFILLCSKVPPLRY